MTHGRTVPRTLSSVGRLMIKNSLEEEASHIGTEETEHNHKS